MHRQVRVNTPNLLNENETKKFAICWLDGRIMVRVGSLNGSVIMEWQDPTPIGVSYVGVRTGWGATGKWKLQTALYPSPTAPNYQSNLLVKYLLSFLVFLFLLLFLLFSFTSILFLKIKIIDYQITYGILSDWSLFLIIFIFIAKNEILL